MLESETMKNLIGIALLLVFGGVLAGQTPTRNNPNGIWESATGTRYSLQLNGTNLEVKLVEGSNPSFLQYELTLQNDKDELNTYKGKGFFRAKLKSGKGCRFETEWTIVVILDTMIVGNSPDFRDIDQVTCKAKETQAVRIDLRKK